MVLNLLPSNPMVYDLKNLKYRLLGCLSSSSVQNVKKYKKVFAFVFHDRCCKIIVCKLVNKKFMLNPLFVDIWGWYFKSFKFPCTLIVDCRPKICCFILSLIFYHTILIFTEPQTEGYWKHCGIRTMLGTNIFSFSNNVFYTQWNTEIINSTTCIFNLSFTNAFSLAQAKNFLFCEEFRDDFYIRKFTVTSETNSSDNNIPVLISNSH